MQSYRSLYDSIVTIIDDESQEFYVHEGLVCKYSAFFKRAFRRDPPPKTKSVIIKAEHSAVFDSFKTWLYTGRIWNQAITVETPDDQTSDFQDLCIKVWIFGNDCGAPVSKNAAIDALIDSFAVSNFFSSTYVNSRIWRNP